MSRLAGGCAILLCGVLVACSHVSPHASIGDFTDQILDPLALRVADEKISEAGAEIRSVHTPKATVHTLTSLLTELPWVGKLLTLTTVNRKAQLEEDLTWLETRRIPLKRELLDLFITRTAQDGDRFSFCVDGVQRRYEAIEVNRFTRLPDGPGPCERSALQSLNKETRSP